MDEDEKAHLPNP